MKKRIILIILLASIVCNISTAQNYCSVLSNPSTSTANFLSSNCSLITTPQIYNIRVNIHYILLDNGTGNFTETNDPFNSNVGYNGYKFASVIFEFMNKRLANNQLMNFQPTPSVTALPISHRYILNGVYFWRSTDAYDNHSSDLVYLKNNYAKDIGYAINVFFVKNTTPPTGGAGAAYLNDDICFVRGQDEVFRRYLLSGEKENFSVFWDVMNHEILHNLSLSHTIREPYGACCLSNTTGLCDDGCSDTPTYPEIVAKYPGNTNICGWCWTSNWQTFSNNMMDYSCEETALTPCQINKVNSNILYSKPCFLTCALSTPNIDICTSPTQSQSYIAKNINVVPASCTANSITLPVYSRIVFNCETTTINKNFEVPLGTEFEVIPATSCVN